MIFRVHEETRGETSRSKPDTSTQWSRDLEEEIVKMSMQEKFKSRNSLLCVNCRLRAKLSDHIWKDRGHRAKQVEAASESSEVFKNSGCRNTLYMVIA